MQEILQGPLPMLLMMGLVFYFLLIRPQMKRAKEHRELVLGLKKGDEVVTQGGLIGKVVKVTDVEAIVQLAKGVDVHVVKQTITDVRNRTEPKPANDEADA
jgi:preprotein translocase subunit YajC